MTTTTVILEGGPVKPVATPEEKGAKCNSPEPLQKFPDRFSISIVSESPGHGEGEVSKGAQMEQVPKKRKHNRFLGILLASMAALFYSLSTLVIKILEYDAINLSFWRFNVTLFIALPFFIHGQCVRKRTNDVHHHQHPPPEAGSESSSDCCRIFSKIWLHSRTLVFLTLQAIFTSLQIIFIIFGINYLEMGDSVVIETSAPVFVTIVAWLFLRERLGWTSIVLALVALVGVGIICKPPIITGGTPMDSETIKGVIFSLASMIMLTFSYVVLRYLRMVHHSILLLSFAGMGLIESGVVGWILGVITLPNNLWEVGMVLTTAVLQTSAHACIILSLKFEQAGVVALVRTGEVIFCYFWQALVLHDNPDVFSIIGALLTLGCVVTAALRKIVLSLDDDHKCKKLLRFLLY